MNWLDKVKESKNDSSPIVRCKDGKYYPANIEDLFYDQACFICASGPSFNKIDKTLLEKPGIITFGTNNSPKSFRPNLWASVDGPGRFLESIWRDPKIMKFCGTGAWKKKLWDHGAWKDAGYPEGNDFYSSAVVQDCPNVYYMRRNNNFDPKTFLTEDTINWGNHKENGGGRSVFIATIKLLYILGFRRVYLTGVDFSMNGDYKYHFDEDRHKGAVSCNTGTYRKMISFFTQLIPYFKEANYNIYNCSPGSDLTLFQYMTLEEAVKIETSRLPNPEEERSEGMYCPDR